VTAALYVLYDPGCALCQRCWAFLCEEAQYVPLRGVPMNSEAAERMFPDLVRHADELVIVSREGAVYRGADAWIICLWALRRYRPWAARLARPSLKPLARATFDAVSRRRMKISRILAGDAPQVAARLRRVEADCEDGSCGTGWQPLSATKPDNGVWSARRGTV
jgi:predicted DCC family thiol-disulfide oxidoreductase YuxK